MVNYICCNCNKNFTRKSDFIYHTKKKKKPCILINDILNTKNPHKSTQDPHKTTQNNGNFTDNENKISTEEEQVINNLNNQVIHVCTFCNDTFARQDSLKRHLDRYCKIKKQQDNKLKIINEIELLKKKFEDKLLEIDKQSKELEKQNKEIYELKKLIL